MRDETYTSKGFAKGRAPFYSDSIQTRSGAFHHAGRGSGGPACRRRRRSCRGCTRVFKPSAGGAQVWRACGQRSSSCPSVPPPPPPRGGDGCLAHPLHPRTEKVQKVGGVLRIRVSYGEGYTRIPVYAYPLWICVYGRVGDKGSCASAYPSARGCGWGTRLRLFHLGLPGARSCSHRMDPQQGVCLVDAARLWSRLGPAATCALHLRSDAGSGSPCRFCRKSV